MCVQNHLNDLLILNLTKLRLLLTFWLSSNILRITCLLLFSYSKIHTYIHTHTHTLWHQQSNV